MIDVMIIAYNESLNLPWTLKALRGWSGRIFVVDSGSTDGTPQIEEERGNRPSGATGIHHKTARL